MKKLFTLLTLVAAFLGAHAQVTQSVTTVLDNDNLVVNTSNDTKTAIFSENGVTLFSLSTEAGTINNGGSTQNLTYNGDSYPALRIGGASSYGGIFTFTFAANVTDVRMYINGNSSSSEQNWYLNGTLQNGNGNTSKLPATGAEPLEVSLDNGNTISLGNVRFNVIFVVTYTTTLPLTVSDFSAEVTEITSSGATVSVSYSVENAAEGSTYEVYYKNADNEEAIAQSVEADATGSSFSIEGLDAKTDYKYDISLYINGEAVENASTTIEFTTLSGPTEPFEINFAELAVNNLSYGNDISSVDSIPEEEGSDYTYRDTTERITINGANNNYQFIVVKGGQEIVSESNLTTSGDVMLRYRSTSNIGLYNSSSSGNRYGILDLKAGDIVEIAIRNGSGAANSVEEITGPTATYNLTEVSSDGVYTLNYTYNQARTLNYKIYTYTVNENDAVTFTIASTYLAYVKVTPASESNPEVTISAGEDETEQSGEYDAATNTITMATLNDQVIVFISTPAGTTPWYAVEVTERIGVDSPDDQLGGPSEMVRPRRASSELVYQKAEQYNGQYCAPLDKNTKGYLYIKYSSDDQEPTNQEPTTFNFIVNYTAPTGVETVVVGDGETVYFDLNGRRVANPDKGIFIKVEAGKVSKVIL